MTVKNKISLRPITISDSKNLKENGLGEIYQSMAMKMALLTQQGPGEFTRITPYVQCRDFLVDVFTFSKVGKTFEIYGMSHNPELDKPQEDGVYLSIIFPNEKAQKNFEANLDHLYQIEAMNEIGFTEYVPQEKANYGVVLADRAWLQNCLTFSLYTSLLRVFCYDVDVDEGWIVAMKTRHKGSTDGALVSSVDDETWVRALENLQNIKTDTFCGYDPKTTNIHTIHHTSGFYSVFGTHRELDAALQATNAHWKYFKEAGWKLFTRPEQPKPASVQLPKPKSSFGVAKTKGFGTPSLAGKAA